MNVDVGIITLKGNSKSVGVLLADDGPFPDIRMLAAEARRRATHADNR